MWTVELGKEMRTGRLFNEKLRNVGAECRLEKCKKKRRIESFELRALATDGDPSAFRDLFYFVLFTSVGKGI